jgi:hypothetical protein
MDLRQVGLKVVDWIHLAQDRNWLQDLVNTVMNLWEPYKMGEFLD